MLKQFNILHNDGVLLVCLCADLDVGSAATGFHPSPAVLCLEAWQAAQDAWRARQCDGSSRPSCQGQKRKYVNVLFLEASEKVGAMFRVVPTQGSGQLPVLVPAML